MNQFLCHKCGACCREPGYVYLGPKEPGMIAAHLGMSPAEFTEQYTRLAANRRELSLTEKEDGSCIFLTRRNTCAINPVKPRQCRDFPLRWKFRGAEKVCSALNQPSLQDTAIAGLT